MFMCVEELCFSNIPSKSDWYKYYCHRFFLGKYLRDTKKKVYPRLPDYWAKRIHLDLLFI